MLNETIQLCSPGTTLGTSLATTLATTLASTGFVLVSFWKPIIIFLPFVGWAWVISSIYDKHARACHLAAENWNAAHLSVGAVALIAAIAMPVTGVAGFLAAFGAVLLLLGADILAYPLMVNKDERVGEGRQITLDFSKLKTMREAKEKAKAAGASTLKITQPDNSVLLPPEKDTPEFDLRVEAEAIFIKAISARASQVDIVPTPGDNKVYVPSFLIDGIRQMGETIAGTRAAALMDTWKAGAGLDVADRRRKQTGICKVEYAGVETKTKVTTSGSQSGLRCTLLFNPEKAVRKKIEELGLLDKQMAVLKELVSTTGGVVLIGAAPDNGATTTMYSILKMHDAYTSNVQTIEADIESLLEGLRQNKFDATDADQEYSKLVRSTLRRDPDVVALGELPDAETAQEVAAADLERSRVYICVRADGALPAVQLWAKGVGNLSSAADALKGVITVKLARKLCENCKVAYPPTGEMLQKLGLPAEKVKQLYKKGGQVLMQNKPETCPVCNGVGYMGQIGLFEVYPIGETERATIRSGNLNGLRAEMRKTHLPTTTQAALKKAIEGLTSVEEVMRITTPAKPKTSKPQPA